MDENKGLKILGETLGWSDEEARTEFRWLKMMAAIKYDDYRDFLPGMRFLENLAGWLQQFAELAERREAYRLLRQRLIYVSPPEMQRLVELLYPCVIERRLIQIIAERRSIPKYMVRVDKDARGDLERLRRRTLILGLSDGARIDILRHSTTGILSNEQFVLQTQADRFKWESLLADLQAEQPAKEGEPGAAFEVIVLVDDFMGTGSSFLRYDADKKKWKGKLCKFLASLHDAIEKVPVLAKGWQLCVHHYLATEKAANEIREREQQAIASSGKEVPLERPSHYTFGAKVPEEVCITAAKGEDAPLIALTRTYYNSNIQTRHTDVGGVTHLGLGYGGCALPLVLHHNTPNNSLALLWAEASAGPDVEGRQQLEMRPLFRRRQRHTV
jgi:hypothetical protein